MWAPSEGGVRSERVCEKRRECVWGIFEGVVPCSFVFDFDFLRKLKIGIGRVCEVAVPLSISCFFLLGNIFISSFSWL